MKSIKWKYSLTSNSVYFNRFVSLWVLISQQGLSRKNICPNQKLLLLILSQECLLSINGLHVFMPKKIPFQIEKSNQKIDQ